jgi:translocator protein
MNHRQVMRRKGGETGESILRGLFTLAGCIIVCQGAGALGAIATMPSIPTWYAQLLKPSFNPPNWLFGPVWGVLYTMMAVSLFLVVRRGVYRHRGALGVFFLQLALNSLWSVVFFGLHRPGAAFLVIVALLVAILFSIGLFRSISRASSWLLVPYAAWVAFASVLNIFIWSLNRPAA